MPWYLIVLNTLSFFSIVIVYIALLDIAYTIPAFSSHFDTTVMSVLFMAATAAGILYFGYSWQALPVSSQRRSLGRALAGNGLSLAALAVGSASPGGSVAFLYLGTLLYPCTAGYMAGYLYYLISRRIPSARQGTCIGIFLAATNLLLFVLDKLTKRSGSPLFLPWSLLLTVLAIMAFLLLQYDGSAAEETTEEQAEATHPFVSRHMPFLLGMAVLLSLLIGFSDTLNFTRHEEYYSNWHALSRLFIVVGSLLAGWLADVRPAYLPLAALASKAVVMVFYALALEGKPYALMACADVFFTSFTIVFLTWMFLQVAIRSRRPAFWAGMGRAIEMPVSAIGTFLGVSLLRYTSNNTATMVAYAALLFATSALFYYALVQFNRNQMAERSFRLAGVPDERSFRLAGISGAPDSGGFFAPAAGETETEMKTATDIQKADAETQGITSCEADAGEAEVAISADAVTASAVVAVNTKTETADAANAVETKTDKTEPERLQEQFGLTKRETEVLFALLDGDTIAEISEKLVISPNTTKFHISHILKKTGVKYTRELPYIVQNKK